MLHLRVMCPAEVTDAVLDKLRNRPGAVHLTIARGAAVDPSGDLVQADVVREAVDGLLADLCELGIDHVGGITLQPLDTVRSDAADAAALAAPGEPADAVVWEELIARTGDDSRLTFTFLAFLTLACLIAVVGVVTDSPITVVGAMVVGPEFAPLAALAVGLVLRRGDLLRRVVLALGVGFPMAMLIAAAGTLLSEWTGLIDVGVVGSLKQVDFIYQVGPFSLILAMLAGAAGMLSLSHLSEIGGADRGVHLGDDGACSGVRGARGYYPRLADSRGVSRAAAGESGRHCVRRSAGAADAHPPRRPQPRSSADGG